MTLTLDRAQQLNAFTHELQAGFASALKRVRDPERAGRDDHRGRRGFCVGRDLDEAPADRDAYRRLGDHHIPNITTLRALQKPVIAAVNGAAAGAGLSLAAVSDIRVRRPRPSPSRLDRHRPGARPAGDSYFVPASSATPGRWSGSRRTGT